jgi:hypothetical protein
MIDIGGGVALVDALLDYSGITVPDLSGKGDQSCGTP